MKNNKTNAELEELLAELLAVTIDDLLKKIRNKTATSSDIRNGLQLLRDNKITIEPRAGDPSAILNGLDEDDELPFPHLVGGLKSLK